MFRVKRKKDEEYKFENNRKKRDARVMENKDTHKSVLFVEPTRGGELVRNLRNLLTSLAPTLGFGIKVVERAGTSLGSKFSQGSLWDGAQCGRGEDCITCSQGTETLPPCTRVSVVYENFCTICNQEARGGQEAKTVEDAAPSIYIGETSRSIQESALEHQPDLRNKRERSHNKHRVLHHEDKETPFMMKVVSFHKSALSRQAAEAVRIRRRGGEGSILNSKAEFNRSYIPRLTLVEEEKLVEMDRLEKEAEKLAQEEIRNQHEAWESGKVEKRAADIRRDLEKTSKHGKRRKDLKENKDGARKRKKLSFPVIGDGWGTNTKEEDVVRGKVEEDSLRNTSTVPEVRDDQLGTPPPSSSKDDQLGTPSPSRKPWRNHPLMSSKKKNPLGIKKTTPKKNRNSNSKQTDDLRRRTILDFWKKKDDEAQDDQRMKMSLQTSRDKDDDDEECTFNVKRICEKHGCEAKIVKLSVLRKKHGRNDDLKDFEYKKVTQTELICTGRKKVLGGRDISTLNILDNREVGNFGESSAPVANLSAGEGLSHRNHVAGCDWSDMTHSEAGQNVIGGRII